MIHRQSLSQQHCQQLHARRRSLFWRIHFWAALIASPFALVATLTGILYIFTPQIEQVLYGHLDQVVAAGPMRSLDELIAAAKTGAPAGLALHSVAPPYAATDALKVTFAPEGRPVSGHEGHQHGAVKPAAPARPAFGAPAKAVVVHVDPYTGMVLGSLTGQDRFGNWSKRLHSRLLQSDNWRWMIELAASWLLVMLLTGVWLWWPHAGDSILPSSSARGRTAWKQWHAFLGVALGLMSLVILATGLTWSKYAGEQIRYLRDISGQASPQVPRSASSVAQHGSAPLGWQSMWEHSRAQAPQVALLLTPPLESLGVWKVGAADRGQPAKRFDLLLDAYSGKAVYSSGWDQQTVFGKATTIGIPFHRGEFGWWNQALLSVFGLGIIFSVVSGWLMYFKRRKPGSWGLPPLLVGAWRSPSLASWVTAVALCTLMPLLALSAAVLVLFELAALRAPHFTKPG
jgi:uncharacterized iron-regulated membrane protein